MEKMDTDNVTFRSRQRANSLGNISNTSMFESTRLCHSQIYLDHSSPHLEMQARIEKIENELLSANNEIVELLLENKTLKKELDKSNKINQLYKKIEFNEGVATLTSNRKRKIPKMSLITTTSQEIQDRIPNKAMNNNTQVEIIAELNKKNSQLTTFLEEEKEKNTILNENRSTVVQNNKNCKSKKSCSKGLIKTKGAKHNNINKLNLQKIRQLNKAKKGLQNRLKIMVSRENRVKLQIHEKKQLNDINTETTATYTHHGNNYIEKRRDNKVIILSDDIGRGLSLKLTNRTKSYIKLITANHEHIMTQYWITSKRK
ncbi:unnamed protein product [Diatraea saccharalis]|uniref:Uncharacterized protein n=1 Tax=Diatraea saccharalis TaxID=40085 RepID=A0A9N9WJ07_9NEOP|nr:unnamed protein product [Diatraea saccharalis]